MFSARASHIDVDVAGGGRCRSGRVNFEDSNRVYVWRWFAWPRRAGVDFVVRLPAVYTASEIGDSSSFVGCDLDFDGEWEVLTCVNEEGADAEGCWFC